MRALKLDPHDAAAYCTLGMLYAAHGQDDNALEQYDHAILALEQSKPHDPQLATVRVNRAMVSMHRRDFVQAIRDLDEAVRIEPGNGQWYDERGVAWAQRQDYAKAIADFKRALALNPDDKSAQGNLAHAQALAGPH